jgi:type I restriction enzyme, R subunit
LLDALGYSYSSGPTPTDASPPTDRVKDISATYGQTNAPRQSYSEVLLLDRLTKAVDRINPHIPAEARHQARRELQNINRPDLISNNETFHRYLTEGITVEYQRQNATGGETKGEQLWLIDWDTVNQAVQSVLTGHHKQPPHLPPGRRHLAHPRQRQIPLHGQVH